MVVDRSVQLAEIKLGIRGGFCPFGLDFTIEVGKKHIIPIMDCFPMRMAGLLGGFLLEVTVKQ